MFTNKDLRKLMIPIILEQLLNSFMGMIDQMMVSNIDSGASMAAVSLVDSLNLLVIQVFTAMATGGAIICSQFIGKKDENGANQAARQVILTMSVLSITIVVFSLSLQKPLLTLVFGKTERDVWKYSMEYFRYSVFSYPGIAIFSAGSAILRAEGNTKYPMKISLISNIINVFGNAFLLYIVPLGVKGAAIATLLSRFYCAVFVLLKLTQNNQLICVREYRKIRPNWRMIGMILAIGIPSGIENGMFQFGKLAIQSTVSQMGTTAIAAQAMTIIFENVNGVAGVGVGIALMNVVGQCMGAGKVEEAKYYIKKLLMVGEVVITVSCIFVYIIAKPVTILAGMTSESRSICLTMVGYITIFKPLFWAMSFITPYGLRAAGDVRFSMIVSTCTMWFCRVALCIYLVKCWNFGPMAVWIGMFTDWFIRSIIFTMRFKSNRWTSRSVIE